MAIALRLAWKPSWHRVGRLVGTIGIALLTVASGLIIGRFGPIGVLLPAFVVALPFSRYWIDAAAVLALLSAFVTIRVPGLAQSSGISLADIVLTLAAAMVLTRLQLSGPLRRIFVVVAIYQIILLAPVLTSGTRASYLEWIHRGVLVGGALVCGAYLVQQNRTLLVLRLWAGLATIYSIVAIATYLQTKEAAYILTLQKNGLGTLLMMSLLVAVYFPALLPTRWRWAYLGLLAAGLFASQSRGAMVGAAVGLFVASLSEHRRLFHSPLVLLVTGLTLFFVYQNIQKSEPIAERTVFSPIGSRDFYRKQALTVWNQSPITGGGLKLFNDPTSGLISDPHNVLVLSLAEGGLIGLAGFVFLQIGTFDTLRRHRNNLMLVAIAVVTARGTHGLFDIYWLGGTGSVCWLVAGMALATPSLPESYSLGLSSDSTTTGRSTIPATSQYRTGSLSSDSTPGAPE